MSEENNAQPQIQMNIITQFVRDLSFENVLAQKGTNGVEIDPIIQVSVKLDARKRSQDNQYDVLQKLNITSKNKNNDDTIFVVELDYAGIFAVSGIPDEHIHPFLLIECARMMFPFMRRIVADVIRDGGLPPFNLDVIDYADMYRQNAERIKQAQTAN